MPAALSWGAGVDLAVALAVGGNGGLRLVTVPPAQVSAATAAHDSGWAAAALAEDVGAYLPRRAAARMSLDPAAAQRVLRDEIAAAREAAGGGGARGGGGAFNKQTDQLLLAFEWLQRAAAALQTPQPGDHHGHHQHQPQHSVFAALARRPEPAAEVPCGPLTAYVSPQRTAALEACGWSQLPALSGAAEGGGVEPLALAPPVLSLAGGATRATALASSSSAVVALARSTGVPLVAACVDAGDNSGGGDAPAGESGVGSSAGGGGGGGVWGVERAAAIALLHGLPGHAVQLLTAGAAELRHRAANAVRTGATATGAGADAAGGGWSRWSSPALAGHGTSAAAAADGVGGGLTTPQARSPALQPVPPRSAPASSSSSNLHARTTRATPSRATAGGGNVGVVHSPPLDGVAGAGFSYFPPPPPDADPAGAHAELLQLTAMAIAGCPGPAAAAAAAPSTHAAAAGALHPHLRDPHANRRVWLSSVRSLMARVDGRRHPYLRVALTVLVEVADPQLPDVPQPLAPSGATPGAGHRTRGSAAAASAARTGSSTRHGASAQSSSSAASSSLTASIQPRGSAGADAAAASESGQHQQQQPPRHNPHRIDTLLSDAAGQPLAHPHHHHQQHDEVDGGADGSPPEGGGAATAGTAGVPPLFAHDPAAGAVAGSPGLHASLSPAGSPALAPHHGRHARGAGGGGDLNSSHASAYSYRQQHLGAGEWGGDDAGASASASAAGHIEISLHDRVAFAVRFLDDGALAPFLRTITAEAVDAGRIDGLLLTGLTPAGSRLVQRHLDRTGDVQAAALVGCYMLRSAQVFLVRRMLAGTDGGAGKAGRGVGGGSGGDAMAPLPAPSPLLPSFDATAPPPQLPLASAVDDVTPASPHHLHQQQPHHASRPLASAPSTAGASHHHDGAPTGSAGGGGGATGGGAGSGGGGAAAGGSGAYAAAAAALLQRGYLPDDWQRMVLLAWRWIQGYRELLSRLQLWRERAEFDVQRAKLLRHQFRGGGAPGAPPVLPWMTAVAPAASDGGSVGGSPPAAAPFGASAAAVAASADPGALERLAFTALLSLATYSAGLTPQPSLAASSSSAAAVASASGAAATAATAATGHDHPAGSSGSGGGRPTGGTGAALAPSDRAPGDGLLGLGPRRSQMHVRCPSCRVSLSLPSLVAGSASAVEWLSKQRPHMLSCPSCRKPLPRCSLCLLPLGCLNPVMQLQHEMRARHAARAQATVAAAAAPGGGAVGGWSPAVGSSAAGTAGLGSAGSGPTDPPHYLRSPPLFSLGASAGGSSRGGGGGGSGGPAGGEPDVDGGAAPPALAGGSHGDADAGDGSRGAGRQQQHHHHHHQPQPQHHPHARGAAAAADADAASSSAAWWSLRPRGHLRDSLPLDELWAWCQSCKHGGHASHLAEWFATGKTVCPVAECLCHCALLDRCAGVAYGAPPAEHASA